MEVNFGNVAKNYAQYRNDLPDELLESLKLRGIDFNNKKVLDLGSGTGVLSRALHNAGAVVVGVEPSAELIEQAKVIDKSEGNLIEYINTYAESTTLDNGLFDYVTVLRAWHWFNREKTLDEIKRILEEKGILIVMDSGFISKSKVIDDTLQIIKTHMPNGELKSAGAKAESKQFINGFPVEWFKEWQEHNFDLKETYKFNYTVSFTNEDWCGRVGSLSWLSGFTENQRNEILDEIFTHLVKEYGDIQHYIQHGCFITILNHL
ncbi:class I SAM-dependent methyltransferase [Peribacillus frigoritolerans]|uniref:class I SAM-dependent methyltransferase n=1 Tax=Peribacillus frigoritolerans TaxID=450367 RepID=UPI00207ACF15|nr:class I SAM-dependent methyltransferase [Peribacillus frigoritolerans]MEE3953461.1 methyltransferase domain-containing protein [Peribacillus frigoritolerans]USK63431.1 class I SAM-dependent methyltransferase [Peribacillus frigoritolerans]